MEKRTDIRPLLKFTVSDDKMLLELELSPNVAEELEEGVPGENMQEIPGQPEAPKKQELEKVQTPVFEEVMAAISELGVTFGVNKMAVKKICILPRYGVKYVIAEGRPADTSRRVEYLFEPHRVLKPKIHQNGTADYRDLGYTQNVVQGQTLCRVVPSPEEAAGQNIFGEAVLPVYSGASPLVHLCGRNTYLSEDQTQMMSRVDGNAEFINDLVCVSDVLEIQGNIDNSTGDINYINDVVVRGDVLTGFKLVTVGNVTIHGTVDGATIQATGNIVINKGINGMNSGFIHAAGDVICTFAQNCHIRADNNINADSLMSCMVECGGDLELKGRRGILIGGRTSVARVLRARMIGSDSNVPTAVSMGDTDRMQNELNVLRERLKKMDAEEWKLFQIIQRIEDLQQKGRSTPEMDTALAMAKNSQSNSELERAQINERIEALRARQLEVSRSGYSYIECSDRINMGVRISFGPLNMTVLREVVHSRVAVIDEKIVVTPLF